MGDHEIGKDDDGTPKIGMMFDTEEKAYEFYNDYGRSMGFSIRKESCHWKMVEDNAKRLITSRRFVCNKYGLRKRDKRDRETNKPRAATRTDCKARMGIRYINGAGQYQCFDFEEEHNHLLHLPATLKYMRSQRKKSDEHVMGVDLADDSGIKTKATYDFMGKEVGGAKNLGYARVDVQNHLCTKRQRHLACGEAESVLKYFQQQINSNPLFKFAIQMDSEEQMTNIFWTDHRMRMDYALFGDVITFHTTFSTNKEHRPFGVFAGFNHHRMITIFGAALLYDETVESFKWLFEAFLETHDQKQPMTMFTDQDAAMAKAIHQVFPSTRHGLCSWHLMQNGIKHLGNLMKDGSSFLKEFKACMYHYDEETDFEMAWQKLITLYPTTTDSWLDRTYRVKEKWANCFMKKILTIGMRSTQLSKSLNGDMKDYLSSKLDVVQFFKHFERVVNDKRENELKAEFNARDKLPRNMYPNIPLMIQAGERYTPTIFEEFHEEYSSVGSCYIKEKNEDSDLHEYVIAIHYKKEEFKVLSKPSEGMIKCSCKKFESFGILCRHALRILCYVEDIIFMPESYILRRWTRTVRDYTVEESHVTPIDGHVLDSTQRYKLLCPNMVQLAAEASVTAEGYSLLIQTANELRTKFRNFRNHDLVSTVPTVPTENVTIIQAKGLQTKENRKGGKWHKSWVEKQPKKKEKNIRVSESQSSHQGIPTAPSNLIQWTPLQGSESLQTNQSLTSLLMPSFDYSQSTLLSSQASNSHSQVERNIGRVCLYNDGCPAGITDWEVTYERGN